MAKRAQQDSGEGRVTAKSRPMMNLFDRKNAFDRVFFSFCKPGEDLRMDIMNLNNLFLTIARGRPVETSRSNYSQEYGSSWSSQVWKSGYEEHDRSGQPEQNSWDSLGKELILFVKNIFSAGPRILQGTKKLFTKERGDPIQRMPRERLILKSSSWEVTQQNLLTKSRTKCEFDRKECPIMQKIVPNIR